MTADEITPLAEPEFLLVRTVIALGATHLYTLRIKVDVSLPVTFRQGITLLINSPQKSMGWHSVYLYKHEICL